MPENRKRDGTNEFDILHNRMDALIGSVNEYQTEHDTDLSEAAKNSQDIWLIIQNEIKVFRGDMGSLKEASDKMGENNRISSSRIVADNRVLRSDLNELQASARRMRANQRDLLWWFRVLGATVLILVSIPSIFFLLWLSVFTYYFVTSGL